MRIRRPLLLAACALTISTTATAQKSTAGGHVLHEFFVATPQTGAGAAAATPPLEVGPGQPPPLSLQTAAGEPVYDEDGPVLDEPAPAPYGPLTPFGAANTLDDRTDRVDSLTYYASFDPSVIPYKRVVVQNRVVRRDGGAYVLEVETGTREPVAIEAAQPGDDLFWGSFMMRLEANKWQPIASVAPGQRLLQLQVEPAVDLQVFRDRADNYFVRSPAAALVRINMHIAARRFYFSGVFDEVAWEDFPRDLTPAMAPEVVQTGLRVASQLGFDRQSAKPRATLLAMVEYFRNFDARPLPEELSREDLFETIATNQIGVCRHRSLAFVIMAQALGIPTRYVYNEAHAFVEVFWPTGGWRRIDLGGAADELTASATANRSLHDAGRDLLPTPPRFLQEQERMTRNGWNPPTHDDGRAEGREGEPEVASGVDGAPSQEQGAADPASDASQAQATSPPDDNPAADLIAPGTQDPAAPTDARAVSVLEITDADEVVQRGNDLLLQGRLTDAAGRPLGGRVVEVYLGPVGSTHASSAQRLTTTTTDRFGRLGARVPVPREHSIGRWSLFLVFGGDETHQPAVAE